MIALVLIALVGATLIVVRGTIFRPLQQIPFFACSQCFGTWIGAAAGASGIISIGHGRVLDAVIVGCATSFLALLADAILLKLLGDPEPNSNEEKT